MINIVMVEALYWLQICMYIVGCRRLYGRKMKCNWILVAAGSILCMVVAGRVETGRQLNGALSAAYFMAVATAIIMVEGKLIEKLVTVCSLFCISACIDSIFAIFLHNIFELSESIDEVYDVMESCLTIGTFMLIGKAKSICQKHTEKIRFNLRKSVIVVVIWMNFAQCLTIGAVHYAKKFLPNEWAKTGFDIMTLTGFVGMLGSLIFILYIRTSNEKMEKLLETERELKQMQEQYYNVLLDRETDTREYRHDMNNHLLCLHELSQEGKTEEIKAYIEEMQEGFLSIQKKCYATGNDIIDILLNYYLSGLLDTQVLVMGKCEKELAISSVEFCTIFSNVIKNAVEEIGRIKNEDKYIKVKIKQGKQYLSIIIRNSSNLVWDEHSGKLKTSKADERNHGFGIGNIEEAVKKNKGGFELVGDGTEVKVTLTLPYK